MGFSIQPIDSGAGLKNPIVPMPAGGFRTPFKLSSEPEFEIIDNNTIKLSAKQEVPEVETRLETGFGFIAATELKFRITGRIESVDSGFDRLTIKTPYEEFEIESEGGDPPDSYKDIDETYTLSIDAAITEGDSCGLLCEIIFDTGDTEFNDGVYYQIEFIE